MRRWLARCGLGALLLIGLAHQAGSAPAMPVMPIPADNLQNPAKIALGQRLFYEKRLSGDGSMACATCHQQARGFADGVAKHPGIHGEPGERNPMALANVGWFAHLTWMDPAVTALEAQAMVPMTGSHPVEMGGTADGMIAALSRDECYRRLFARAYPGQRGAITLATITAALASFERTLVSLDSPYDRFMRGDAGAISPQAKAGLALFVGERLQCAACHKGVLFTDATERNALHQIARGIFLESEAHSYGSDHPLDTPGQFRTPSLRNVAVSGPWMHDGSAVTLADAMVAHNSAVAAIRAEDLAPLIAFLESLTDHAFLTNPAFGPPAATCPAK